MGLGQEWGGLRGRPVRSLVVGGGGIEGALGVVHFEYPLIFA